MNNFIRRFHKLLARWHLRVSFKYFNSINDNREKFILIIKWCFVITLQFLGRAIHNLCSHSWSTLIVSQDPCWFWWNIESLVSIESNVLNIYHIRALLICKIIHFQGKNSINRRLLPESFKISMLGLIIFYIAFDWNLPFFMWPENKKICTNVVYIF